MDFVEALTKLDNADLQLIHKIAKRSEDLKIGSGDRQSRNMDLVLAHSLYNLDLERFLNSDEYNFVHDFMGIQNKIDRENCLFTDEYWLPRFVKSKQEVMK